MLGTVALRSTVPPQQGCISKSSPGDNQLRTGLVHLDALSPYGMWAPQHTPAQGRGSACSLPGAAWQPLFHPWLKASFIQGEESIFSAAITHSQMGGSKGTASPSISSWPVWDTAGELAPMAALRGPHGHTTRVPPKSMAEQGCSPSPDSIQQPAALRCWHCHLHPFHPRTLVSICDAPQPMPTRVHGGMPALLSSSAPGSPVEH